MNPFSSKLADKYTYNTNQPPRDTVLGLEYDRIHAPGRIHLGFVYSTESVGCC